jgi:uncharacterized protein
MLDGMNLEKLLFFFFLFSFFGWVFELFLEVLAGRGFVNRGFFYGPVVPIYAAGFFFAYALCYPLRDSPVLVFFTSMIACTALEYVTGWILEKFLHVRAWDYDIHPLTFWCNYKKRIALTASLSFGVFTLGTIYVLWDTLLNLTDLLGTRLLRVLDGVFLAVFLADLFLSVRNYLARKKAGTLTPTKGIVDYETADAGFFEQAAGDILAHPRFLESKQYIQHGNTSVFQHSVDVAVMCYILSRFWRVQDRKGMIRAALLHDFFLYDWHSEWKLDHGFTHPAAAAENARRYFGVSDKEYSLIRTHMWPFTLLHPPRYKEGWFICMADKIVSLKETLHIPPVRRGEGAGTAQK